MRAGAGIVRDLPCGCARLCFHRVQFDKGDGQEYEHRQPRPQLRHYSVEDDFGGEHLADECRDEARGGHDKTDYDGRLHRFGVPTHEYRQAYHKHYVIDDGISDAKMFLAVELGSVFDLGPLCGEPGQLPRTQQAFVLRLAPDWYVPRGEVALIMGYGLRWFF